MRFIRLAFVIAAVVAVLMCLGSWAPAKGPVADFPNFIYFNINKTGDVAVDKVGNVYVNVTETDGYDRIWKFSAGGEGPEVIANLGIGTAYGLAINAEGDVYAINGGNPDNTQDKGVYRVDRYGNRYRNGYGNPVRLPGTEQIFFPNALALDQRGNLYVTESVSGTGLGGIWRIPPRGGEAELWLQDSLLTGIGNVLAAFPFGANGIAFYHGDLYVANSDKYLIVRIRVRPDGTPGEPEVWWSLLEVEESPLKGWLVPAPDGIALDVYGNVYVAVVTRAAVVRINAENLSQETIAVAGPDPNAPLFAPLDFPNMLAFGTGKGGRQSLFVTNVGMVNASLRGLVKTEAGVPGLPLP